MNSITDLLNLEDADIFISDISIRDTYKFVTSGCSGCQTDSPMLFLSVNFSSRL